MTATIVTHLFVRQKRGVSVGLLEFSLAFLNQALPLGEWVLKSKQREKRRVQGKCRETDARQGHQLFT